VADQDEQKTQTAEISGTVQLKQDGGASEKKPVPEPEETVEKKTKKRHIAIVVVLLVVAAAGWYIWRSSFTEDTDDAQVDGNLYQVSSRVAGQVLNVDVDENQTVLKGQPIAEIDPRDLQVALTQAEADLASAQADYVQATTNVPITSVNVRTTLSTSGSDVLGQQAAVLQAQANVSAAEARVEEAKANSIKAQLDVERYTPLVAKDVISKQQFDAAVATAAATKAALAEAERSVGANQVKVEEAHAQAAFAAVQQAQAKVDQAKLNVGYTKILAPIDGIVSKKNVSAGENLSVGQDLLTIVPLDDLWVTANFKETQLKQMQQGQKVELKVDALGGRKFEGKLTQIGGATGSRLSLFPPENATGNYVKVVQRIPVRIDFTNLAEENKDHALRPGMSVTPDVTVKQ